MDSMMPQVYQLPQFETEKARLARLEQTPLTRAITSDEEYRAIAGVIVEAKTFRKEWDETTKKMRALTKAAHDEACKIFSDLDRPLKILVERATPLLADYDRRQEAARRAEEDRINAQLAAEEKTRQEAESKRIAELHPMPEGTPPAEDLPPVIAPPPLVVAMPKFVGAKESGLNARVVYSAVVTDLKALAKAIGAGKVPVSYILPNESILNVQIRALKKMKLPVEIPGVEVKEETDYAAAPRRAAR